jgi:DNA-binding NarL/FixJ family response regulator
MVVAGVLKGAPLLVHLFDDSPQSDQLDRAGRLVRETLASGGADILTDHPESPGTPENASNLTSRELEVLRYVALGWESRHIAGELGISTHTVRNHIRNFRQKLNASTKLDAVVAGVRLGILNLG